VDLVSVSPREPGTKALAWELVRLRGGGIQGATRGLPATASSGRSVITRRYDQPDHSHRDKPVFSAPNVHRYSSQPPTQPSTPSEEHGQTGSLRRSHPGAQWNGGSRLSTGSLEPEISCTSPSLQVPSYTETPLHTSYDRKGRATISRSSAAFSLHPQTTTALARPHPAQGTERIMHQKNRAYDNDRPWPRQFCFHPQGAHV
jgi:hypothetical protein